MIELQLPICALIFSILLCVVYFSKKRIKLPETSLYSLMLLMGTLDCIILTIERFIVRSGNINDITPTINLILQITNKIDFIALIIICSCLFLYTLLISYPSIKNKIKKIFKIVGVVDIIVFIYIFVLNVNLITSGRIISVSGGGITPAYITCGIYILLSIIITILNLKRLSKKHIPILSIIFIFIFLMMVFKSDPYIMIISITITFVNYLMYFTIENPDLKMVNELLRNKELIENQIEDKSDFLFEMSQSIKNPAKSILEMTKTYPSLKTEEERQKLLKNISIDANELIFNTNNILDVSSMDANLIKIIDEDYSPYKLFNEIKVLTDVKIKSENVKFNINISDNLPTKLSGDYYRLKQIIMSILLNSVENTSSGYINVHVDSITRYDVCRLILKVEDSGSGMSIKEINSILDSSVNLNKEEIEKIDKLDVDLTVALKIIKLLGGNINIKSEKGKGTVITVVMDQRYKMHETTNIMKKVSKYSSEVFGKKRILIVDDDKEEIFKIKTILSKYNLDVNSTMLSKECIDKIASGEVYSLIIIDDELRKSSALTVLNELKKIKKFNIPVAVLATREKENLKKYYINDGFKHFILKEELSNELEKLISKYL